MSDVEKHEEIIPNKQNNNIINADLKNMECKICFGGLFQEQDDVEIEKTEEERISEKEKYILLFKNLSCRHVFCIDCIQYFIEKEISEKKIPVFCPQIDSSIKEENEENWNEEINTNIAGRKRCGVVINPETIKKIVSKEYYEKFINFQFKIFLEKNPEIIRPCPNKKCDHVYIVEDFINLKEKITCPSCKTNICKRCNKFFHEQNNCENYNYKLSNEEDEDKDFIKYIKQHNVKKCPNCKSQIEKNDGCNHMTCQNCKHEFCFDCGKDTKVHHDHRNQKYDNEFKLIKKNEEGISSNNKNINEREINIQNEVENAVNSIYTTNLIYEINYLNGHHTNQTIQKNNTNKTRTKGNTIVFDISNEDEKDLINLLSQIKDNKKVRKNIIKNSSSDIHLKSDGTPDMRFKENKNSTLNNTFINNTFSGPLKSDGTPDMRFKENKNSNFTSTINRNTSFSNSVHLKKDGTPDMRYKENKGSSSSSSNYSFSSSTSYSSYSSPSYSSYSSGGYSRYSGGYNSGPLKSDGTPDMRYSCNKSRYGRK